MTTYGVTDYAAGKILEHVTGLTPFVFPTTWYLGLATDTSGLVEVTGGSYARQLLGWVHYVGGSMRLQNDSVETFTTMPSCTVQTAFISDALTGGNMWFLALLSSPLVVASGGTVTLPSGQAEIGF